MAHFYDTHCHLNLNLFQGDLSEVIQRAADNAVERILVPGIDLETSFQAVKLSDKFDCVFAAIGVHPNAASDWNADTLRQLLHLSHHPKVVAIGEIGLDLYHERSPIELQLTAFKAQLQLAEDTEKPVILHSRLALTTLLPIIQNWQANLKSKKLVQNPGVLHAFEGNLQEAQMGIDHAFQIGIGGPVTYKNALDKQELASRLPLSSLLLETDAPFLSPHPFRGQRNEPARIIEIARKIAFLRQISLTELGLVTTQNADLLLGWSFPR